VDVPLVTSTDSTFSDLMPLAFGKSPESGIMI
jgi:hypothetical protein